MKTRTMLAAVAAFGLVFSALADFNISLDLSDKPMKDLSTSTCGPTIGYAGCLTGDGGSMAEYWFVTNRVETAAALKSAGAWFQRMWSANDWFARRKPNPYNPESKDKKERDNHRKYRQVNPDSAFKFWKDNGFKVLFTLEAWSGDKAFKEIIEFVDYIVANEYQCVVAGFELGNETYFADRDNMPKLCATWNRVIPEIKKRMPDVPLGVPVCEYYENNPDLKHIRARCLDPEKLKREGYFSASAGNQTSAAMILALSNNWHNISHIIYHAYGAESPYSCSYYGFQRFRNFEAAFPEVKGKRMWLSEIRMRSDEDDWCHRMFRESLIMGHYALMAICQPEFDGYNQHEFASWAGGIYVSNGRQFTHQWPTGIWHQGYPYYRSPENRPHIEVGSMGVMYRIFTEAIMGHPHLWMHGTSKEAGTEDGYFTSARFTDEVYARRRALREGKKAFLGLFGGVPKVKGEVEWVAATDAKKQRLCLMMVNSKSVTENITVRIKDYQFAAPTYRTVSCPGEFLDCAAVPGEVPAWRELAWEDTQEGGYGEIKIAMNEGMQPTCDVMNISIAPHTIQSVTVYIRKRPQKK